MQTGLPSFYDENMKAMYQQILTNLLDFLLDMTSEVRIMMTGLLQLTRRLGANRDQATFIFRKIY
jgi:hypothetical protein